SIPTLAEVFFVFWILSFPLGPIFFVFAQAKKSNCLSMESPHLCRAPISSPPHCLGNIGRALRQLQCLCSVASVAPTIVRIQHLSGLWVRLGVGHLVLVTKDDIAPLASFPLPIDCR